MNRMPFFAHASGFTIKDSHMSEVGGDYFNIHFTMPAESTERIATQLLGKRKECDLDKGDAEADGPRKRLREVRDETSDGLMVVHSKDIDLQRQLTSGSNYRTHSAFYEGRVVAVKVFEGPRAKQSWNLNLTFAKNFLHSNVPKIVGISDENRTESPFIVFHGISDRKMSSLLANALRTDLNKSVRLSMRTVKGLAAGLSYMESQNLLPKGIIKLENFDIFAGGSDEPVLSIHLSDTTARGPPPAYHPEGARIPFDQTHQRTGTEMLSGLCQKLFTEVNTILYDDSPERELDADDLVENYSSVVQSNREGHPNDAGDVSSPTEVRTAHNTPRREVRWQLDKSANNRSLESIVRHFEDYLDCVSASSADSPLHRITASPHKRVSHRCPGYLREEITLTADVSRSVVVAHQYPSQSEICTICGQLVQHPSNPVPHPTTNRRRQPPQKIDIPTPSTRSYPPESSSSYDNDPVEEPRSPSDSYYDSPLEAVTPVGAYSPPSGEPNLHVLGMESPGLFGRRSPPDSYYNPSIYLTPSLEEPAAFHDFESSGLFRPRLESDADWGIATPENQILNIQMSGSAWQPDPAFTFGEPRSSSDSYYYSRLETITAYSPPSAEPNLRVFGMENQVENEAYFPSNFLPSSILDPHDPRTALDDELNRMNAYDDNPAGIFGKRTGSLLYDSPGAGYLDLDLRGNVF